MVGISGIKAANGHLGRTMQTDRLAHHWTLRAFADRIKVSEPTLSRVENGLRPMTEKLAVKCDEQFPERRGWYLKYYTESKSWTPPGFKDWGEYEGRTRELVIWCPGIVDGSAQTDDYAQEILSVAPVAPDVLATRLASRMERQKRLFRDGGPLVTLLVDHVALYRGVGSAEVMAVQCARLAELAAYESVTVQVVPPVRIPLSTSAVMVADDAAYTENAIAGSVYTEPETVTRLRRLVGIVRSEALQASRSLAVAREAETRWTGASRHTAKTADKRASKSGGQTS
jgi:hypothetical protein